MKKQLLLVSFLILIVWPVCAQTLESSTISSGGTLEMTGAGYTLQDVKGQGVGGSVSNETYTVDIGGLYGLVSWVAVAPGVPWGTIPLFISVSGSDVKITWEATTYPNAQLFVLFGDGSGRYSSGEGWVPVTADLGFNVQNLANGVLLHTNQIGGGTPEVYYKGLQAGVSPTNLAAAWAVGKLNIPLYYKADLNEGYNLISVPLITSTSIDGAFSNQLKIEGVEVYSYDDATQQYTKGKFINGNWVYYGAPQIFIERGKAYWVKLPSSQQQLTLTCLGEVARDAFSRNIVSGYNLMGLTFPRATTFGQSGITAAANDEVYLFHNDTKQYEKIKYVNGAWLNADPTKPPFDLTAGSGYWYKATKPSTWEYGP